MARTQYCGQLTVNPDGIGISEPVGGQPSPDNDPVVMTQPSQALDGR